MEWRSSYRRLVEEFIEAGEPLIPFPLRFAHDDFPALIAKLESLARGIDLPEGFVPNTTFWLVDRQSEVVGVSNLRHALTPRLRIDGGHIGYGIRPSQRRRGYGSSLLRATLAEARTMGLGRVLLICDRDNRGSIEVILRNRGQFDSEEYLPDQGTAVRRYWIAL